MGGCEDENLEIRLFGLLLDIRAVLGSRAKGVSGNLGSPHTVLY